MESAAWLAVQDRKSHQSKFPSNGKAMNSWLVGLVKCACCGYALHFNHSTSKDGKSSYYRFIDYGKYTVNGCSTKSLKIRPKDVESAVFDAMRKRISQLEIAKHQLEQPDAETENLKTEIVHIGDEIQKLMEKLADSDSMLFEYIQKRITALHEQKSECEKRLRTISRKRKAIDTKPLEEPMNRWDSLSIQEKHELAVSMIDVVLVSDETGIEVKFSI